MTTSELLAFCTVYTLALMTPGPAVAAVVARSIARGVRSATVFIVGLLVGEFVWFALAAAGLGALVRAAETAFLVIKYAGASYLVYMAYRLWVSEPAAVPAALDGEPDVGSQGGEAVGVGALRDEGPARPFLGGLALALGNPKPMVFFLALLPTFVNIDALGAAGLSQLAAVIVIVLPGVLGAYAVAADRARRVFRSPRALKAMNRGAGVVMAVAALAVVTR